MKHLFVAFIAFSGASAEAAVRPGLAPGYSIETRFDFQSPRAKASGAGSTVVSADNRGWQTLTPPRSGVTLLGRVAKVEADVVTMEYLVVDTNRNDAVASAPRIIAKLGEKAQMDVMDQKTGAKIHVGLLVKATSIAPLGK